MIEIMLNNRFFVTHARKVPLLARLIREGWRKYHVISKANESDTAHPHKGTTYVFVQFTALERKLIRL